MELTPFLSIKVNTFRRLIMSVGSIGAAPQTYGLQNGAVSSIRNEAPEIPRANDQAANDANRMGVSVLRDPALGNEIDTYA
jgi:hypothetical protein